MLGRIRWSGDRKIRLERETVLGMPLLALNLPERERGLERRVGKGARLLTAHRVTRVLTPQGFVWWPVLELVGLRPVDTKGLRCALAAPWVRACLAAQGIPPGRAVVRLCGERVAPDVVLTVYQLCQVVRNLVIDLPQGEMLAARIRREYGVPILPARCAQADLTLRFNGGPALDHAAFALKGVQLPGDCEPLPFLAALWECGRIKTEDIEIFVDL